VRRETFPPLLHERLAIDDHEGWHGSPGDHAAGKHGLPRAGWRDKDTELVRRRWGGD
jgi:hypothetical protein